MTVLGYFDGANKGQPGPAGIGALIIKDGVMIWEKAEYIGLKTNNEAEYMALLAVLKQAVYLGIKEITIRGDSLLVVNQVNRKWKCETPHLKPLLKQAWEYLAYIPRYKLKWIPRTQNTYADALSKRGRIELAPKEVGEFA